MRSGLAAGLGGRLSRTRHLASNAANGRDGRRLVCALSRPNRPSSGEFLLLGPGFLRESPGGERSSARGSRARSSRRRRPPSGRSSRQGILYPRCRSRRRGRSHGVRVWRPIQALLAWARRTRLRRGARGPSIPCTSERALVAVRIRQMRATYNAGCCTWYERASRAPRPPHGCQRAGEDHRRFGSGPRKTCLARAPALPTPPMPREPRLDSRARRGVACHQRAPTRPRDRPRSGRPWPHPTRLDAPRALRDRERWAVQTRPKCPLR